MCKSIGLFLCLLLLGCILSLGNGLRCYQCTRAYRPDPETDSVSQANIASSEWPLDSCLWGRTPEEQFIVDCPPAGEEKPELAYACVSIQIFGKLRDSGRDLNATWRECATSAKDSTIEQPNLQNSTIDFSELKEGILSDVTREFKDPTGKTFLEEMSISYDDTVSTVKIISCDTDLCKEQEEEKPSTESSTTQESSSTTQDSGGFSNAANKVLLMHSIFIGKFVVIFETDSFLDVKLTK